MARIISIFVGLFFTIALAWSFCLGFYTWATDPVAETVEHAFHRPPEEHHFASDGPLGHFDRQQLQRGFQVYKEVCATCHAIRHVAIRDLAALGYSEAEVKAIAKSIQIPVYNKASGELETREGMPTDYFPPVAYAGLGTPPDLSLMTKARHHGPQYVRSLLMGYQPQTAELLKRFPDAKTPENGHYNPYFANLNLAMPPPLTAGQVTYSDGTNASVEQMATDVSAFLVWTAEPKLEKRHQTGWAVVGFLLFATILGYMSYRNIWAGRKH